MLLQTSDIVKSIQPQNRVGQLWAIGVITGLMMGLFGIGALLAGYFSQTSRNISNYCGNLCLVFVVDNIFRIFAYTHQGILGFNIFLYSLYLTPAIAIGMYIAGKVDSKLKESTVKKIILFLIIASGLMIVINNIKQYL